ncbi:hypothetical protein BKA65DRAFT_580695 [Rhexocercosporidium sp. MPI-PUGE-AT-0058]|nr:hypothetical protein BKA65DRAFT_580695 [Rhexocercosporidium sp. MPI-PUGE-AT-0058]
MKMYYNFWILALLTSETKTANSQFDFQFQVLSFDRSITSLETAKNPPSKMHTTLFTLPLPLLLFLLTQSFAYPVPATPPGNPPSLLEAYLDFNRDLTQSPSSFPGLAVTHATIPSNALPVSFNAHANVRRGLNGDLEPQFPLSLPLSSPAKEQDGQGSTRQKEECKAPHLSKGETKRLMSVLTSQLLSLHRNGIAFPYSANTHCSTGVELTARTEVANTATKSRFNAKFKLELTPARRDVYGMKRGHFVSLVERIVGAGLEFGGEGVDEKGEEAREERRGILEGVSGDVEWVARFVVSPVLEGGCVA